MKLALLVLWAAISTLLRYVLIDFPLFVIGLPLVAIAAFFTETVPHSTYYDRTLLQFKWRWMWLYNNQEDGVDGLRGGDPNQSWWANQTYGWRNWERVFVWSGLRNSVNNLRFVPVLSPLFTPDSISWVAGTRWIVRRPAPPAWPTGSSNPTGTGGWAVARQGLYVGVTRQFGSRVLTFGYNFRPGDEGGALMIGSRMPRARLEISLGSASNE